MLNITIKIVLLITMIVTGSAMAGAPPVQQIPYSMDTTLEPGVYGLKFSLWDIKSGVRPSNKKWEEQKLITIDATTISTNLGDTKVLPTKIFSNQLYVQVEKMETDGSFTVLGPRTKLTMTPYSMYRATTPTILCKQTGRRTGGSDGYTFDFTADDCGGKLPDSNYVGTGVIFDICNGFITWRVNQAPNPGVSIYSPGPCGHYEFQVLYIKVK